MHVAGHEPFVTVRLTVRQLSPGSTITVRLQVARVENEGGTML